MTHGDDIPGLLGRVNQVVGVTLGACEPRQRAFFGRLLLGRFLLLCCLLSLASLLEGVDAELGDSADEFVDGNLPVGEAGGGGGDTRRVAGVGRDGGSLLFLVALGI